MSYPKQQYVAVDAGGNVVTPSKDEALLIAIRMCNVDRCKELIDADVELLHAKGWNQLTPLHQACLSGQVSIVTLLLNRGANPNARNSYEETPLHYACRRGVVAVVHLMIKNGADPNCVDKRGRNCMHFAVNGGSVAMLHYLRAHTDLNFDTPDDTGQNILHVSCEMGQFPCIYYLTKHHRVDPSLKDLRGVTPMHLAIEKGHGDMVWFLLQAGGCELLGIKNQKGESPLDLAKKGNSERNQMIYKILQPYSECKGPPRGPIFHWYFLLFMPFIYMAVMFILTNYMNSYGGHFMLLMSILLAYYISKQFHRIMHLCRWPNPIFLGMFMAGIVHCAIAQFGYLQPALWPCPITTGIVTSLAAVAIYLLWYLLYMDPGIDTTPMICPSTGKPMSVLDIAEGRASEEQFSPFSEMLHGEHTKYCKICEQPMLDLDHHCLFINACVAKNNHKQFVLMLIAVMILQVTFIYCTIEYMRMHSSHINSDGLGDPITPYLIYLYKTKPWIFCLTMLCALSCLWESSLIYAQLSMIMRGTTTYQKIKNKSRMRYNLTKIEMLRNLIKFFLRPNTKTSSRAVNKAAAPYSV